MLYMVPFKENSTECVIVNATSKIDAARQAMDGVRESTNLDDAQKAAAIAYLENMIAMLQLAEQTSMN